MQPDVPVVDDDRVIRLRDGRRLSFCQYGDPGGRPILLFHGFGGSRCVRHPNDAITTALGVRLITIDRPGIGRSDAKRGRTVLDWADDVVELADALHIDRFTVLGYSWGGPYALACAYKVPHRLSTVGVVSSMSGWLIGPGATTGLPPGFRRLAHLLRIAPWLMYPALLGAQRNRRRKPEWVVDTVIAKMPPSDQAIVTNLKLRPLLVQTVVEAWRQDVSCIYTDIMAISRPWGFSHRDIALEVNLWHGEQDTVIYPEMGRRLAAAIPNCRAVFYPDEGHFLIFARWAEILATLAFPSTVEVGSLERVIGDESTPQTG